jgi:hypothetical protein
MEPAIFNSDLEYVTKIFHGIYDEDPTLLERLELAAYVKACYLNWQNTEKGRNKINICLETIGMFINDQYGIPYDFLPLRNMLDPRGPGFGFYPINSQFIDYLRLLRERRFIPEPVEF